MESSRPRNSTLLDALIAALLAVAALVALTGGFEIALGSMTLRSHSAWRVLAIAVVPIGLRLWQRGSWRPVNLFLLTLIFLSIGYWFKYLLTTIGGADTYGYASAARLLASGKLIDPAPLADWLSSPNRLALTSPLGWAPSSGGSGISPTYPLGLPALMAVFSTMAGANAIFYVSPVMALLTLWLTFRLAHRWGDDQLALLATALVAWNPVFLTYAKQPMSDVAATAWLLLAFHLVVDDSPVTSVRRDALAGLAAGAAFLTRPALIVAVALIPPFAWRGANPFKRMVTMGVGIALAAVLRLALQAHMFGNPFTTGYGSTDALFSWAALPDNIKIYAWQSRAAFGLLWIVAVGAGAWAWRGRRTTAILALAAAVTLPYLFYLRFDHWETLRFLLPGVVPLTILAAAGVMTLESIIRVPRAATVVVVLFVAGFAIDSERLMRTSSVWDIQDLEARYPLVGQWFQVNSPAASVVLASQHSGSLRWYGGRQTVRWDLLTPAQLLPTVHELEARGATVYAALEGTEQQGFATKFSNELAQLSVDAVGHIRNVNVLRITNLLNRKNEAGSYLPPIR